MDQDHGLYEEDEPIETLLNSFEQVDKVVTKPLCDDNCYVHGYEPVPSSYYKMCYECQHVFVTEQDLIDDDVQVRRNFNKVAGPGDYLFSEDPVPVEEIFCCPHCSHDF